MPENEKERITSEEYVDLLVEYSGDYSVFDLFPDASVRIINYLYAVVHIPAQELTVEFVSRWGFSILPVCYGVVSLNSIEATGIPRIRNIPNFNLRGQGVLMGFVDTGIDYENPIFSYADGTTRIVSIWDQSIESGNAPMDFDYGTEYTREDINAALQSENPLEIVPSTDQIGHGTMLAGIAAGNESVENNFYGIATDSELVIVKLKQAKKVMMEFMEIPQDAVCYSATDVLFGINYLLQVSTELQRPIIICVGIGSSHGGHGGRDFLANSLSLVGARAGTAVIIAAGNEGNGRRHYYGSVDRVLGYDTVELVVGENEPGFIIELWGQKPNIYSIDFTSPSGEYIPRISGGLDNTTEISFIFENTIINVFYELVEKQSGDPVIIIRFQNPAPGIWRFRVYERGNLNIGFNMWLPMRNFISESTFFVSSDNFTTILSPGNSEIPITATAYNDLDNSIYLFASRGYTRLGNIKPDIAAPGVNVIGPTLDNGFAAYSGTSVAAAHTAGVAALLMEWGYLRGNIPNMNTIELKELLLRGARRETGVEYPNQTWGYGILDVFNTLDVLRTEFTIR